MLPQRLKRALTKTEKRRYVHFLLTTGTFQTYGTWKANGCANPFAAPDYRADMVTRAQIVDMFFKDA